jgi:hypothetical protein
VGAPGRRVPQAERDARLNLLEESIRLLLRSEREEDHLAAEVMRSFLRDELRAAALDLPEREPPRWLDLAARKIPVRWAEAVTRQAADQGASWSDEIGDRPRANSRHTGRLTPTAMRRRLSRTGARVAGEP